MLWISDEAKSCKFKRAQHLLGTNAKKVDDQVELISKLLREAMLSRKYKTLETYINFPINFHVTDFRGTELRKDAKGYDIGIMDLKDFAKNLIELTTQHSIITDDLKESAYSKMYVNRMYVYLISVGHNITLITNKDFSVQIDSILIKLF